ncbi:Glycosyl transferase family 2 [uncultured archaeon]|nr:Glycosyl transferase family 2 [uncultured archaeon]
MGKENARLQRPVLFTPAYNEAKNVGRHLKMVHELQKEGVIGHVLIIADGSTDKTAEIARQKAKELGMRDMVILQFHENQGKAMAFFEALNYFKTYCGGTFPKEQAMVMLDADLLDVTPAKIRQLLSPLEHGHEMAVAQSGNIVSNYSGQRAFRLRSLMPVLTRKVKKILLLGDKEQRGGYGLELFLNDFFRFSSPFGKTLARAVEAPVSFSTPLRIKGAGIGAIGLAEMNRMATELRKRDDMFWQLKTSKWRGNAADYRRRMATLELPKRPAIRRVI